MSNEEHVLMVEVTEKSHGVVIDLAYATADNFTGRVIYNNDRCFLHRDAEVRLVKAVEAARLAGFKLKILDAYRSVRAHEELWKCLADPRYVADISIGSNHSRGVALDVTLLDVSGKELDMGTAFDYMQEESHHGYADFPHHVHRNRLHLLGIMLYAGFCPISTEWWHYELPNSLSYPVI